MYAYRIPATSSQCGLAKEKRCGRSEESYRTLRATHLIDRLASAYAPMRYYTCRFNLSVAILLCLSQSTLHGFVFMEAMNTLTVSVANK